MTRKKALKIEVAVLMGSQSDWPVVQHTVETLNSFGVGSDVRVMSAHRTPHEVTGYVEGAADRGVKVIIASAGMAAHLAGVVAAHTTLPVIGVPMKGGAQDGVDALLATVQMPGGVPVATVALGKAGAVNAAILAVQILALGSPVLRKKLQKHKQTLRKSVMDADRDLQSQLEGVS